MNLTIVERREIFLQGEEVLPDGVFWRGQPVQSIFVTRGLPRKVESAFVSKERVMGVERIEPLKEGLWALRQSSVKASW